MRVMRFEVEPDADYLVQTRVDRDPDRHTALRGPDGNESASMSFTSRARILILYPENMASAIGIRNCMGALSITMRHSSGSQGRFATGAAEILPDPLNPLLEGIGRDCSLVECKAKNQAQYSNYIIRHPATIFWCVFLISELKDLRACHIGQAYGAKRIQVAKTRS